MKNLMSVFFAFLRKMWSKWFIKSPEDPRPETTIQALSGWVPELTLAERKKQEWARDKTLKKSKTKRRLTMFVSDVTECVVCGKNLNIARGQNVFFCSRTCRSKWRHQKGVIHK